MKSAIIFINRIPRQVLRVFFHFDKWHCATVLEKRYVKDIVTFLNHLSAQDRNSAIEIGTGLGDIIRKLDFENKIGYDRERNVITAAGFISKVTGDNTSYEEFIFPGILIGRFNVILMVNWIHHVEPIELKKYIEKYTAENLLEKGCIVIDTVQAPNYKFNHDIRFLTADLSCKLVKIGDYENRREVYAIFK